MLSFFLVSCYTQLHTVKVVKYVEYEDESDEYYEEEDTDTLEAYSVNDDYGNVYNIYLDDSYYYDDWGYDSYYSGVHISLGHHWGYYYPYFSLERASSCLSTASI